MSTAILQVRDIPESVLITLRLRAERRGLSLSGYVREILADEASQPTMADAIDQITHDEPIELTNAEIVALIDEGRRDAGR